MKKYFLHGCITFIALVIFSFYLFQKKEPVFKNLQKSEISVAPQIGAAENFNDQKSVVSNSISSKVSKSFSLFSENESTFNKITIIENLFDSGKMEGYASDIYDLLLKEKDPEVIKPLTKLLMQSFDKNTDVVGIIGSLLKMKGEVAIQTKDYLQEYLSADEIKNVYKNNNDYLDDETKDSLILGFMNNSVMNAQDPLSDEYMRMSYDNRKNTITYNPQDIMSVVILSSENNTDYLDKVKASDFIRNTLRSPPTLIKNDETYMWFKANLMVSKNEQDSNAFIQDAKTYLNQEQKANINEFYPDTFK